jgi:hypothetical protein
VSIADASAACERLQANSKIPVSCNTDYVDDVPSMIVGFRNVAEARQWLAPFAEGIGNAFCAAANRHGREARVYMTVGAGQEQTARRWSCELGKWGDWFANPPRPAGDQPPQTIAAAIAACNQVQANSEMPVSCRTDHVDGVPSMIVGFPTAAEVKAYMPQVAEQVAGPFCAAANRTNRRASLYMTMPGRARHYDCELQRWGEWFEVKPNASDNRSTQRL